ncbi:MAG TPA: hypothetical protein VH417_07350 [Vicinamibacterales bacterium]
MTGPTPLLDWFTRGEAPADIKLLAAQGRLAPRAHEQLAILMLLVGDGDGEVRSTADATLNQLPQVALRAFLARSDVSSSMLEFFAKRGVTPAGPAAQTDEPLLDAEPDVESADAADEPDEEKRRESLTAQLAKMNFPQRLKAAVKGNREMRAVLIRDPNRLISTTVLSSPKVTEAEIANFSRMANVSEDVLRIIGTNRAWTKNYGVVLGLTKNPKTPIGMSLNFLARLSDSDVKMLAVDRNVPEPLRIAARKRLQASRQG